MDVNMLHDEILHRQDNICGITVLKRGNLSYNDFWHGYHSDDTVHVMSVTKSVVSLMIGIALDQGLISDVRQPVLDFFPDYQVKKGEKTIQNVTIEHLLTMTAPYKYRSEPWTKICTSENWTTATLDILGGRSGLTRAFRYSTLGIHILTGLLARVSGLNTVDYANRYLFEPIGVARHENYFAETAEEHKRFTLSKQPKGNVWFSDPQGIGTAGYGLCLSAPDMARIGQLCLNDGVWGKQRIVSAEWLRKSTKPRQSSSEAFADMKYGYLWWTPVAGDSAFAALGNSGNVIYVDPQSEMVVSVAATFKPRIYDRISFIRNTIVPMFS